MRIIETVFPIQVPQQPRVFTLEVEQEELRLIFDGLLAQAWAYPMDDDESTELRRIIGVAVPELYSADH